MSKDAKGNIHLILRNTDALSGTPRILRRQAKVLTGRNLKINIISETFHTELLANKSIQCLKTLRWPKNSLIQRKFFDWQTSWKRGPGLIIGHGDTLHQDLLFMHTCVHKAADLNPDKNQHKKNLSLPFHRMIFEQGSFKTLVCNSRMMSDDLTRRFSIKVPTYILYPGYEASLENTIISEKVSELRGLVTKGKDKIIIGVVTSGNLENRGAFALLRAAGKLGPTLKEKICILIVGKEGRPEKIYHLAQEVGLKDMVHWMEPRDDVANIISAADIIVHAAKMEAFGMSVLESMALQRPIICTETVGCAELLPPLQKEFIISAQSDDLIAQKLETLLNLPDLWKKMGEENFKVAKNHTWEKYDEQFLSILEKQFPTYL